MIKTANLATKNDVSLLKTDIKKLDKKLSREIRANRKAIGETRLAVEGNKKEILGFKWEIDKKLLTYQERTEKMITDFKDVILKGIDGIVKELASMREEKTITDHQFSRHDDKLENHERRIYHLESPVSPPIG